MKTLKQITEDFFQNSEGGLVAAKLQLAEKVLSMVPYRDDQTYQEGRYFRIEDDLTVTLFGCRELLAGGYAVKFHVPDGQTELGITINNFDGNLYVRGKDLNTLEGVPASCIKFALIDSNISKIDYFPICKHNIELRNLPNINDLGVIPSINKNVVNININECGISSVDLSMMSSTSDIAIRNCDKFNNISKTCNQCRICIIENCPSISNINNIPKNISKDLIIRSCPNIISLKGCPKTIGRRICLYNVGIKDLEYSPKNVIDVYIEHCKKLKTLRGLEVNNLITDLSLCGCSNLRSIDTTINAENVLAIGLSKNLVIKPGELNITNIFDGIKDLRWESNWGVFNARKYKGYSKAEIQELTGAPQVVL